MSMVGRTNDVTFNAVFGIFIVRIQFTYYGVAGESTKENTGPQKNIAMESGEQGQVKLITYLAH